MRIDRDLTCKRCGNTVAAVVMPVVPADEEDDVESALDLLGRFVVCEDCAEGGAEE